MKDFIYVSYAYQAFLLPSGKMVDVYSCRYDAKVDLENGKYIPFSNDEEYQNSELPTFNELVKSGVVSVASCVDKYDIDFPWDVRELSEDDFESIMDEFKENKFNVTMEALLHNYECWKGDLKSGFRDEKNGYHLFTPCGCNPLSFRATTLHILCDDWQITYEC